MSNSDNSNNSTLSDPQATPGTRPRRAEPLQPDKPGQGDGTQEGANADAPAEDPARKHAEQEQTALDNVRKV
jgi:hypothetical protein